MACQCSRIGTSGLVALAGFALGESPFDGVEVAAVSRQLSQSFAVGFFRLSDAIDLVGGQFVLDVVVAWPLLFFYLLFVVV